MITDDNLISFIAHGINNKYTEYDECVKFLSISIKTTIEIVETNNQMTRFYVNLYHKNKKYVNHIAYKCFYIEFDTKEIMSYIRKTKLEKINQYD